VTREVRWVSSVIVQATKSDHEVRLVDAEGLLGIEVDGEIIVRLPSETFDYPIEDIDVDEAAAEIIEEIAEEILERRRRKQREKELERTVRHRLAEGATLGRATT